MDAGSKLRITFWADRSFTRNRWAALTHDRCSFYLEKKHALTLLLDRRMNSFHAKESHPGKERSRKRGGSGGE